MAASRIRSRQLFEHDRGLIDTIDYNTRPATKIERNIILNGQSRDEKVHSKLINTSAEPPEIRIAHGCLLIPAIFVFWWYWTKRAARRAMRGLLTNAGANHTKDETAEDDGPIGAASADTDVFNSWDEVIEHDRQDKSLNFVQWFNGRRGRERRRLEAVTRRTLAERERSTAIVPVSSPHNVSLADNDSLSASSGDFVFDDSSSVRSVHWECIEDMGGIEMCTPMERDSSYSSNGLKASVDEILANDPGYEKPLPVDYHNMA